MGYTHERRSNVRRSPVVEVSKKDLEKLIESLRPDFVVENPAARRLQLR